MGACCAPPGRECGFTSDAPCVLGEPGGQVVQVNVAANVWGLSRGQCGVWVSGTAVPSLLGVAVFAA